MAKKEWLEKGADGNTFRERLLDLMANKGITQLALSKATGISQSRLSDYIIGKLKDKEHDIREYAAPDCANLITLANYFGVSTDFLLGLTVTKSPDMGIRAMCDSLGLSEKTVKAFVLANRTHLEAVTAKSYDDMHAVRKFAEAANLQASDMPSLSAMAACTSAGFLRLTDDMATMVLNNPSIGCDFFSLTIPADPPNEHPTLDYFDVASAACQINCEPISYNDMKRFQIYEIATAVSNYLKLKYTKGRDERGND